MTSSNDKGNTARNTTQANLQTQQQRPSKWHVAQKRALVGDLTVYCSMPPPDMSCRASAQRRAWHSGRICPPTCRINHTIQVFGSVSLLWVSCQCFGRKMLAFLNRTMWCSKLMMCCKKPSSFLFTTAPFSIYFSFLLQHHFRFYFHFYYSIISIYFSFLLQHHFRFLFPFYYSTIFDLLFLFTTAPFLIYF